MSKITTKKPDLTSKVERITKKIEKIDCLIKDTITQSIKLNNHEKNAFVLSLLCVSISKALVSICLIMPPEGREGLVNLVIKTTKQKIKELDKK